MILHFACSTMYTYIHACMCYNRQERSEASGSTKKSRIQSYIMANVNLDVVGNWLWGAFQEVSQAVIHASSRDLNPGPSDI